MKRLLGSALLIIGSIVLSVVMAELATRMIDGHPLFAVDLRPVGGTEGSDTTANHLDKLPRAEGATREL